MTKMDYEEELKELESTTRIDKTSKCEVVDISEAVIKDVLVTCDVNDKSLWNASIIFKTTKHI